MEQEGSQAIESIGFLAVVEHQHGLFGGYLVLNAAGRPLEFHCTAPVKANRAQEILYGPTLKPYLYGEQIGLTLVEKSKLKVPLVLTDCESVLALRHLVDFPVALVADEQDEFPRLSTFAMAGHVLAMEAEFQADRRMLSVALQTIAERLDLDEPFQRIHEAIGEAQRAA